jgi:thiol-disulfide isomerase/thioredoxin
MMRRLTFGFLALLLVSCISPSKDQTVEAEGAWKSASRAFNDDVRTFMVRYRGAQETEQQRMLSAPSEPRHKWTPRMRALALRFRGNPAAVRFDRWLLQNGGIVEPRYADEAAARILAADLSGPRMLKVPSALRAAATLRGKEKTSADLERIASRTSDPAVQAEAIRQRDLLLHPPAGRIVAGMQPPSLRGRDFDGALVDLAQHRGEVVLIDFWGAWCGPCVAKMPMIGRVADRFTGRRFVVIGVNSDRDHATACRLVREKNMRWQNVSDAGTEGPVAAAWNVTHWPTLIIIGTDGRVAAVEPDDDAIIPIVQRLLDRQPVTEGEPKHAL